MIRAAAIVALLALAACHPPPTHDGYPVGTTAPWTAATELTLDGGSVKVKDVVDYAVRRRAAWFALPLPDGARRVDVHAYAPPGGHRLVGVQLELIGPDGRVLGHDRTRRGHGSMHLFVSSRDLPEGRYLVHVFTSDRSVASQFGLVVDAEGRRHVPSLPTGCIWVGEPPPAAGSGSAGSPIAMPLPDIPCIPELPALP